MNNAFENSRALWNRMDANLESDETLAQVLDRGEMAAWRKLYQMAAVDARLRTRIKHVVLTVALPLPHFWLAALANLGEPIDWNSPLPDYFTSTAT